MPVFWAMSEILSAWFDTASITSRPRSKVWLVKAFLASSFSVLFVNLTPLDQLVLGSPVSDDVTSTRVRARFYEQARQGLCEVLCRVVCRVNFSRPGGLKSALQRPTGKSALVQRQRSVAVSYHLGSAHFSHFTHH